jgi:hypothetical protein
MGIKWGVDLESIARETGLSILAVPPTPDRRATSLAALGLARDAIDAVAETVAGAGVISPRPVTESDLVLLLRSAYAGTRP